MRKQTTLAFLALAFLALIIAPLLSSAAASEFKDQGISFEHPPDWAIRCSGMEPYGNITISGPDEHISLFWTRDVGIEPEKYLDQAAGAYQSRQLSIVSQERGTRNISGARAWTLDLTYEFKGRRSNKLFAAWNSEGSDRTFFAVLSGFGDNYTWDEAPFDLMLDAFQDLSPRKPEMLMPRITISDAWAAVLQDLLNSYHYLDPSTLPTRSTSIQVAILLTASGQSYRLSSDENLSTSLPAVVAIRPAVVQHILAGHGYQAKLCQMHGAIWVIVKDPAGRWQSISVNPSEPSRTLGVLIKPDESPSRGLVYDDLAGLLESNAARINGPVEPGQLIQKDCDPSSYVELIAPTEPNSTWIRGLSDLLDSRSYGRKYEEGVFDCSNVSQICWSILQGQGYDARLMFSYQGHPLGAHMWIAVRYPYQEDRYVAVEATNVDEEGDLIHLGRIISRPEYYKGIMYNTSSQFSRLQPEEGLWLTPGRPK